MSTLTQDLYSAFRALKKAPGTTAVIVLALALGIGVNTAIFSLVNIVMLRPLPYTHPDRLVAIWQSAAARGLDRVPVGVGDFYYWKEHGRTLQDLALFRDYSFNVTGGGNPESVEGAEVTGSFFDLLGVGTVLGRTITAEDDRPGAEPVAVLSNDLWKRMYGGAREAIGKKILLDDTSYTVVGVLPARLRMAGVGEYQIFVPAAFPEKSRQIKLKFQYSALGRLKPGATVEQARADLKSMSKTIQETYPEMREGIGVDLRPLREEVVGDIRPALLILLGAVAFVLLIACANAANMLLARALGRSREVAVRSALGAGRGQIVRQFLTESVVLSLLAGALGLAVASLLIPILVALSPGNLPQMADVGLDPLALLFTLGISLLTGFLFGVMPALQLSRVNLNETLKESAGSVLVGNRSQKLRAMLVVAEVALALVLLIGAGLMMRSLFLLQRVDPGFRPAHLLTLELSLPAGKYPEDSQQKAFFRQAVERLAAVPRVTAAGSVSELPFSQSVGKQLITLEGRPVRTMEDVPASDFRQVSPRYLETMGIALRKGRSFQPQDRPDSPPVALVNQTFAREMFPDQDVIGKRFRIGVPASLQPEGGEDGPWFTIVGVVGDVRHTTLKEPAQPEVYALHEQLPSARSTMFLVLRTPGDPASIADSVRKAVWELDPNLPIARLGSMEELMAESTSQTRFTFLLLAFFAASALILAILGIYGVMSYFVSQRKHEIGLRMALGAERGKVLLMVVRQGLTLAAIGLAIGLMAAFAMGRVITSQLYGISSHDVATFVGVPLLLLTVSLLATGLPARRATRIEPMIALRSE
jgi:putative ABC transport system permease protein